MLLLIMIVIQYYIQTAIAHSNHCGPDVTVATFHSIALCGFGLYNYCAKAGGPIQDSNDNNESNNI